MNDGKDRVYFERRFPLHEISNDIRNHYPSLLYRLSVDEINALDKNDMNRIEEIIEESQIINELVSSYILEIEERGYPVYDSEVRRIGEEVIIRCYAISPDMPEGVTLFSLN